MGKGFRCFSYALIGVALILAGTSTAWAHVDPSGASGTGFSLSLTAFRNDGTTPVLPGTVNQCETIIYRATLGYFDAGPGNPVNGAIQGGTLVITDPDGAPHDVTPVGGIPCLGGTDGVICTPGVNTINSLTFKFTAHTASCPATLNASVTWAGGVSHISDPDTSGVGGTSPLPLSVSCCVDDGLACNGIDHCDPTLVFGGPLGTARLGGCVPGTPVVCNDDGNVCNGPETCSETSVPPGQCVSGPNAGNSTVCPDTDGNACTTAGCNGTGACDQNHTVKTCADDGNVCNGPESCDPVSGNCVSGPPAGSSTPCPKIGTDACNTPGCDGAGACDQLHIVKSCPDDGNVCNGPESCDPVSGNCVSGPNASDSTECPDDTPGVCPFAGCEAGVCVQDHIGCPSNVTCRTPGFWGTHGGIEKFGSQNLTQLAIDQVGSLLICGKTISTTDLAATSALQAICVSPKGDTVLQLARQLTAAALNCVVTKSSACLGGGQTPGDVCGGIASIEDLFDACNAACAAGFTTPQPPDPLAGIDCIEAIDCFNNGGTGLDAQGVCSGDSGCHDRNGQGCFDLTSPGPAGSPRLCNTARKDCITIFGTQCP